MKSWTFESESLRSWTDRLAMPNVILMSTQIYLSNLIDSNVDLVI